MIFKIPFYVNPAKAKNDISEVYAEEHTFIPSFDTKIMSDTQKIVLADNQLRQFSCLLNGSFEILRRKLRHCCKTLYDMYTHSI